MTNNTTLETPLTNTKRLSKEEKNMFFKDDHDLPRFPPIKTYTFPLFCPKKILRPNFQNFNFDKDEGLLLIRPKKFNQLDSISDMRTEDSEKLGSFDQNLKIFFEELQETIPQNSKPRKKVLIAKTQIMLSILLLFSSLYLFASSNSWAFKAIESIFGFCCILSSINAIPKLIFSKEQGYKDYNKTVKAFVNAFNQRYLLQKNAKLVVPRIGPLFLIIFDPGASRFLDEEVEPVYSMCVDRKVF